MRLIDTHTHLDFPDFDADRGEVLARSRQLGVERLVVLGVYQANWQRLWDLVQSAEALQADVLAVSFTAAAPAPLVQDTLTELRSKLPRHVALWAGGQHPLLHRRPPADITVLGQISDLSTTVQSWRQAHPRRVPSAA